MTTTKTQTNYFAELAKINVNEYIERKGQFSYLSWPFAVEKLRQFDPAATWVVQRFDGLPYLKTEMGVFVEVAVTIQGITLSQIHPVLDSKNRPLLEPSSFDINTSIQRCLVKAIALHGLGLYIYAGEDLPQAEPDKVVPIKAKTETKPEPKPVSDVLSSAQLRNVQKLIRETGTDQQKLLNYFQVESLEQIPALEYARVIRSLEKQRKEAA